MRRFTAHVESLSLSPAGQTVLRMLTSEGNTPRPGQAFLSLRPGTTEVGRSVLFPVECLPDGFSCERPIDRAWRQGDDLDLLGPIGTGFRPPVNSRRWLVLSVDTSITAMLPLVQLARERRASVSLWASTIPRGLPPDVEVATSLRSSLAWADFLAVSATASGLTDLRSLLSLEADEHIAVEAQALVVTNMPCGFGACMACGVRSRRGWKLACQDGPVFPLGGLTW